MTTSRLIDDAMLARAVAEMARELGSHARPGAYAVGVRFRGSAAEADNNVAVIRPDSRDDEAFVATGGFSLTSANSETEAVPSLPIEVTTLARRVTQPPTASVEAFGFGSDYSVSGGVRDHALFPLQPRASMAALAWQAAPRPNCAWPAPVFVARDDDIRVRIAAFNDSEGAAFGHRVYGIAGVHVARMVVPVLQKVFGELLAVAVHGSLLHGASTAFRGSVAMPAAAEIVAALPDLGGLYLVDGAKVTPTVGDVTMLGLSRIGSLHVARYGPLSGADAGCLVGPIAVRAGDTVTLGDDDTVIAAVDSFRPHMTLLAIEREVA